MILYTYGMSVTGDHEYLVHDKYYKYALWSKFIFKVSLCRNIFKNKLRETKM